MNGMPPLAYEPAPCSVCGAVTAKDAETRCRLQSDQDGERYCPGNGDEPLATDGRLQKPTAESLAALNAWCDAEYREDANADRA